MKPKNKAQVHVLEAQKLLKPVTSEARKWAHRKILPCYFLQQRRQHWCLECGNRLDGVNLGGLYNTIAGIHCPKCSKDLVRLDGYKAGSTKADYWAVIDTAGEYQVVRMLITYKHMKKGQKVRYFTTEIMQHFIDEEGSVQSLSKMCNTFANGYADSWIHTSKIELRTESHAHQYRTGFGPEIVYPKTKALRIFRRNGFKTSTHGVNPKQFFNMLARRSEFETLLKAKQYDLLRHCAQKGNAPIDHWPQMRICIRHGYKVKNASDWVDYIELLKHFGRDTNNPQYVCPADFKAQHNRYVDKRRRQQKAEKLNERRAQIAKEDPEYKKLKSPFFDLQMSTNDIIIEPLKSVAEFIEAGDELRHCLFANNYHRRVDSLILAAKKDGKYIETVEFSLAHLRVVQSRGLQNKATPYNKIIVQTVNSHMPEIAKRITKNATP